MNENIKKIVNDYNELKEKVLFILDQPYLEKSLAIRQEGVETDPMNRSWSTFTIIPWELFEMDIVKAQRKWSELKEQHYFKEKQKEEADRERYDRKEYERLKAKYDPDPA